MFPHTFNPEDVTVLLEKVEPNYMSQEQRHQMIANGIHYNELISKEGIPSQKVLGLFKESVDSFGDNMAQMIRTMALTIHYLEPRPVLVSLVRAGTPTGILVRRALLDMGVDAPHFSVSIVQGRGFDEVAIEHILSLGYRPSQLIFIDGWTGKGVVRSELSDALKKMSKNNGRMFRDELFVLSDIAGVAEHASTREDVLIPSALLSGPLCGLVSRTLYRGTEDDPMMHGAAYLDYMEEVDVSSWFIELMDEKIRSATDQNTYKMVSMDTAQELMSDFIGFLLEEYNLPSRERIKPGVGESSRLFLRKPPAKLIIRDTSRKEVAHLLEMAKEFEVDVVVMPEMPYLASCITQ